MIKSILNRLKSDYLLKNRIKEYDDTLSLAINKGYEIISHSAFYELVKTNQLGDKKYLLIRHDIDSDPLYCKYWLEVEKKYGVKTTYYFRLCTINLEVMKDIHNYGADCGYHYEEIADFAKDKRITSPDLISKHFTEIQDIFKNNLIELENKCGFKIESIASHGDFANRKLGIPNHKLITNEILNTLGVTFEAYQPEFLDNYTINISDCGLPKMYKGEISSTEAINKDLKVIHLLVHPKHWRSSWKWNSYENYKRIVEGIRYK